MLLTIGVVFVLTLVFYLGALVTHILVIFKVIPFENVNGGRSKTYEDQYKQSIISIIILFVAFTYILLGFLIPHLRKTILYLIVSSLLALMWLLGTVMQLIGTKFERYYLSWLNVIGSIAHIKLATFYFIEID